MTIKQPLIMAGLFSLISSMTFADEVLNIRTNPFMILGSSFVNLELDFRVNDHWSLGPAAQSSTTEPLFKVGARATYFEQGTFQPGWMTGLELKYSTTTLGDKYYDSSTGKFCDSYEPVCSQDADQLMTLAINEGYFWRWGTFNAGLGLGSKISVDIDNPSHVIPQSSIYFSIGWVR